MRRLKVTVLAVGAAMVMSIGFAAPAGAADPPGRSASNRGLVTALIKQSAVQDDIGNEKLTEQVSLNIIQANNPDQPGVTPGGGGVEP